MAAKTLEKKMKKLLESGLREGRAVLEVLPNGHIAGHVISPEFDGKQYRERLSTVNDILESGLTESELLKVSTLLTYTPAEWSYEPSES